MADLTRRTTFTSQESPTAAKLHQLVEDAALVNVTAADTVSGTTLFRKTTPASPVAGDTRIDGVTGIFENYDGAAWNQVTEDPITITLNNADTLTTCYTGSSVRVDYENDFSVTPLVGNRGTNEAGGIGVSATVAGPGVDVTVIIRGPAWIIAHDPTSLNFESGSWVRHPHTNPSTTAGVCRLSEAPDSTIAGATVYGRVMAVVTPGAAPIAYPGYITGKR